MNIAYVLTSLGMGGAERQALGLAERMAHRGHSVRVMVLSVRLPREKEWPTGLEAVSLGMDRSWARALPGMAAAKDFVRAYKPDLLHSHSFHATMTGRLMRVLSPSVQVVSTFHNVYEGGRHRMLAYRLTDRLSRVNTAVSEAVAQRFIELKSTSAHRCIVVRNGIDVAEFAPSPERRRALRQSMGAEQEFVWLCAGRIAPAKDYPNLLRAFARVRAEQKDAALWIAGAERSAIELAAIRLLEAELRLEGAVRWLGLCGDMPALLDAADGFVSGSAWEGMPLAVGEAMAMQKPVVATDVGGTREMVGDAGTLVPPRDDRALGDAMLECMRSSHEEREAQGRLARERIAGQFSMDAIADEWEAIYRRVLKKAD